jgi:hypothetical protein
LQVSSPFQVGTQSVICHHIPGVIGW